MILILMIRVDCSCSVDDDINVFDDNINDNVDDDDNVNDNIENDKNLHDDNNLINNCRELIAPDTLTSWSVDALCINPSSGLGVSNTKTILVSQVI